MILMKTKESPLLSTSLSKKQRENEWYQWNSEEISNDINSICSDNQDYSSDFMECNMHTSNDKFKVEEINIL